MANLNNTQGSRVYKVVGSNVTLGRIRRLKSNIFITTQCFSIGHGEAQCGRKKIQRRQLIVNKKDKWNLPFTFPKGKSILKQVRGEVYCCIRVIWEKSCFGAKTTASNKREKGLQPYVTFKCTINSVYDLLTIRTKE